MRKLMLILFFVLIPVTIAQDENPTAEIFITDTVIATDIEAIGANITGIAGGTNLVTNNLIRGSGMEPAVVRYLIRVESTEAGWITWNESLGGVSMWDQNFTGFGDGATVRLYRLVDAAGQPLDYGGDMNRAENADHVQFLGETTVPEGGWIAEGEGGENRVYLTDSSIELAYGDYAIITVKKTRLSLDDVNPRLREWFQDDVNYLYPWGGGDAELVPHPGTLPAEFTEPGETCLMLTAPDGGGWFGQFLFHGVDDGEGTWYSQLEPGVTYRAEAWLRQEGVQNGEVYFLLGGAYGGAINPEPWIVTDEWQHFSYEFVAPDYPNPDYGHGSLGISVPSSGTVWIDNFVVYRSDLPVFAPHPVAFDELMASYPQEGRKPAVRFYPVVYGGHSTMDHLLSNYANGEIDFIYNLQTGVTMTIPQALNWSLATGDTPENRVVPYITISEEYTEVEWLQLVEYLGVPYDPAVDTPEGKPWAYLRYQQRGIGAPWTDDFREIVLEFGNETWHNGAFGGWDGFGRPNYVFFGGQEYGLFAHYYLVEHVAAQPWWTDYNLSDKITFSLNAGYDARPDSYGEIAAQQVPELSVYVGHANYVGPKWETEEEVLDVFNDEGMQDTLIGGYLTMLPLIEQVNATRQDLMAAGLADYRPVAYEGGPSGYFLPGNGTEAQVQATELYGKSLGMAVSALDAWLFSSQNGYGHQAYLGFASGEYWSSHTMPLMGGFRRHAGWLALMMRNLYAPGDEMLETTFASVPTTTDGIPLISAYTIRDENTLSVFVLSRRLDDATPVTIHLPINQCASITRYALTTPDGSPADPRSNNIDAENIAITSVSVDASICVDGVLTIDSQTGGTPEGMPPGTVYLYVFEGE
mgnify:CR=1 FL=1